MTKAADLGNPQAQYDLGAFYQFGRGVPIDKAKAAEWTGKAADGGLPAAQVEYATMLFKGRGVEKDEEKGAKLFYLAAEKGNPVAQNRVARLHANGLVFELDLVQAAKWHLLAREAGVSDFSLDIVLTKLTPEQRVAAERLVDAYEGGRITEDEESATALPNLSDGPAAAPQAAPALDSGQQPSLKAPASAETTSPKLAPPARANGTTQPKSYPKGTQ